MSRWLDHDVLQSPSRLLPNDDDLSRGKTDMMHHLVGWLRCTILQLTFFNFIVIKQSPNIMILMDLSLTSIVSLVTFTEMLMN